MVSKQKRIFDKRPVDRPLKEKTKTEDEFVPLEESIFALKKKNKGVVNSEHIGNNSDCVTIEESIFCHTVKDIDDEDSKFEVHGDEVPFEESIFAKKKKSVSTGSKVLYVDKDKKIDYEELFSKYKDIYMKEYISNAKRLTMIDSNVYNNCCILLEESRKTKIMNVESYDVVKRIIKSVCTCIEDVFYSYTNTSVSLVNLIIEMNPGSDILTIYHIIDRSYAEVIEEFRGKNG